MRIFLVCSVFFTASILNAVTVPVRQSGVKYCACEDRDFNGKYCGHTSGRVCTVAQDNNDGDNTANGVPKCSKEVHVFSGGRPIGTTHNAAFSDGETQCVGGQSH